jgi:AhpD family alkylhydroperoxidase
MIRHVKPVGRKSASGVTARVYEAMGHEFGVHAEAFTLHSPAEELLAGIWMLAREHTVAAGNVERAVKEAVAAAVSGLNECPYCVDAHTAMLTATGHSRDEPEIARAVEWARATRSPRSEVLREPPFTEREAPEMIGTATLFHYINRPVSVFCGDSPLPGQGRVMRGTLLRIAGRRFRRFARARPVAGESLELLPAAELPDEFAWARASPAIAGAWGRFAAAAERAGERALPAAARDLVLARLESWHGGQKGLGLDWLDESLAALDGDLRPAARLALLAAFAPYRVDDRTVAGFRAHSNQGCDAEIVEAVCWSSFAAARRTSSWLTAAPAQAGATGSIGTSRPSSLP